MVAYPSDIVGEFRPDIPVEFLGQIIYTAGKHKVLPHHQAQLVTDIIEKIIGIIPASPDPDHVKMGIPAGFKQAPGSFAVHPGKEIVLGNIIRPHGKNTYAVHLMGKFFTELILSPADPHGTQPDPSFPYIEQLAILPQLYTDGIKRLFPIAVGPPQAGLLYFYFPFL